MANPHCSVHLRNGWERRNIQQNRENVVFINCETINSRFKWISFKPLQVVSERKKWRNNHDKGERKRRNLFYHFGEALFWKMISHVNLPRLTLKNLHWITKDNNLQFPSFSVRARELQHPPKAQWESELKSQAVPCSTLQPTSRYIFPYTVSWSTPALSPNFYFLYRNRVHCKLIMLRVNPIKFHGEQRTKVETLK